MLVRHGLRFVMVVALCVGGATGVTGCEGASARMAAARVAASAPPTQVRLPTGATLDPVAPSVQLGSMPLAVAAHPGGRYVVALLNGWREQGIQVFDRRSGQVVQTVHLPAVFLGLTFNHSGDTLFVSGGYRDAIYEFVWDNGRARLIDSIALTSRGGAPRGQHYPAGIALSADGRTLYVAENLSDSLAVVDIASRRVRQRLPLGRYPYGVVTTRTGEVFATAWDDSLVFAFRADSAGTLSQARRLPGGRHPSAMLLNRAETRLFVASASTDRVTVLDTRSGKKVRELLDAPPRGPKEGSTPNALALSADESRLFVAEADNNAVAVFEISEQTVGDAHGHGGDSLTGRIPVEWYPTALLSLGDSLLVVSGKGRGTSPNPDGPTPYKPNEQHTRSYTLGQLDGTLMSVAASGLTPGAVRALTARVADANGWNQSVRSQPSYPPFQHVIYIIKENRTYDEVLGDLSPGDGDSSLALFPRSNTPNHHALAERFGIFDRFFVNAEVSADGHNWSTGAYVTDYVEKTEASHYSKRGRTYDYEGTNRGVASRSIPDGDVSEPANGYLWDLAQHAGITFRNYGEFVSRDARARGAPRYVGNKPFLAAHTNAEYPGFDLDIPDQHRVDIWLEDFRRDVKDGTLPQLTILRLPNDHTAALKAGALSPRSLVADNDLALGRLIEALSSSRYWPKTAVFVLEDDAQNGPDHVDSHRSELFVISAYNAPGVYHRFANTTDVVATMAEILHLGSLSQFDYFGRPLRDVFAPRPNLAAYTALKPSVSLVDRNPLSGPGVTGSARLDLSAEDRADEDLFNVVLWRALKGPRVPYPGPRRASLLDVSRAQ
jgi:YVTN family beta-propeller protein